MHEFSVCSALISQVRAVAQEHGAASVGSITVRIGPLSGVEPDLLKRAFDVARGGPPTDQSTLVIEHSPLIIRCRDCGHEGPARPNRMVCQDCDGYHVSVVSGDEMLLASVELHGADHAPDVEKKSDNESADDSDLSATEARNHV